MEPALAAVARRQMAVFTLQQALASGYSLRQVQQRRQAGAWDQVHAGVYRAAGAPIWWEQGVLAATLGAGPGAVASHRSAARLWGLADGSHGTIELSVPLGRYHRLDGVVIHRSRDLSDDVITRRQGIPVTTVARSVVDLAAVEHVWALERAVDVALAQRLVTLHGLRQALDSLARRGRPGVRSLRLLLDERSDAAPLAESVLEARMLRLCRNHRLPEPACQHPVRIGGRLVARLDFAYPGARVAVEVDGYEFHSSLDTFRRDRRRQNDLVALGWTVLRFTWDDVVRHSDRVARAVTAVLRAKSHTGG